MACKMQRRIALRRKLQILRSLTKSKSEKKRSIIRDTSLYIHNLKLQVEAIRKHLLDHIIQLEQEQQVNVENVGTGYLEVRVRCKKGELVLPSILQMFEDLNVNVVQASITCKPFFGMEAILKADIDATILNHAILNLLQMHTQ